MANFLTKLFGSKSQRDLKELNPILSKCLEAYDQVTKLSNDELRAKTVEFKNLIKQTVASEQSQLDSLQQRIENEFEMSIDEKQKIYTQIEDLEKN